MDFTDLMDSNATAFGQTVTYTAPGESAQSITGVWQEHTPDPADDPDGLHEVRRGTLQVESSELSAPERRATVTVDGEDWKVMNVHNIPDGHSLDCERVQAVERGRGGHRRTR